LRAEVGIHYRFTSRAAVYPRNPAAFYECPVISERAAQLHEKKRYFNTLCYRPGESASVGDLDSASSRQSAPRLACDGGTERPPGAGTRQHPREQTRGRGREPQGDP